MIQSSSPLILDRFADSVRVHRRRIAALLVFATILGAGLLAAVVPASAATLTRYPWINKLTPTSVLITWQTDTPSTGTVEYSEDLSYSLTATDPASTVDHAVLITGLTEETLYFYRVVSGTEQMTIGEDFFFTPSPTMPFMFVAFGDIGRATTEQVALAAEIENLAPDLGILTGDIIYEAGEAVNFTPQYFDIYKPTIARVPFYTSLGNHDRLTADGQPYLDAFYLPTNSATGTERYYSFDHGNAHFVCLQITVEDTTPDAQMLTWLDQDLAASGKMWKFVFFHVPAYSNSGTHGGDATIAAALEPIFLARGVDVVFQGHNHYYTRTYPLVNGVPVNVASNPVYTNPSGPVWIVTGGGGRGLYPIDPLSSIEAYSASVHHVVAVTIVDNQLGLAALKADDTVFDAMTITKSPPTAITVAGFMASAESEGIRLSWNRTDGRSDGGFYIDRAPSEAGPWTRLTPEMLRGSGGFEFVDRTAEAGVEYVYRLTMVDGNGQESLSTLANASRALYHFAIDRPRPNPTRGAASIPFTLDRAAQARVLIVDVSGRLVRTVSSRSLPAGPHAVNWDGRDESGRSVASGIYFAVVRVGDREMKTRLALLR
ncbi:MAG TPA: metallophosphoesterase [Candidatus Eisenbacteria bacterium]|nr:metallophosphoesterase [Candidatus Eisenbacteria bacterium]